MTATAHALIGGAIAASIPNPEIGLPLSFISHPLIDMIPHWDFAWGWRKKTRLKLFLQVSFDFSLGLTVAYLLFGRSTNFIYFLAAIFFSQIWDLLQVPYWFLHCNFPPFSTIYHIQSKLNGKAKLPWGILNQVTTVVGFILFLRIFQP